MSSSIPHYRAIVNITTKRLIRTIRWLLSLLIENRQKPILNVEKKGLAMRTITIRVRAVDFAEWMTAMRVWLDQHQFEPSKFKYAEDGDELVIDVSFEADVEAAAFSARFNGGDTRGTSIPPPAARPDISIDEADVVSSDGLIS